MLTAKIGTNRSDQSDRSRHCGQSGRGPTSLTGGSDRSDRSRRNSTVIRILNRFRSVNRISCRVSLPHPINIKGHDRLREQTNRIYQTLLSFYLFLCINLFQPYVLFVCRLHGLRGRPNWPVETRAIQRALALTGSLLSERSLDLRRATRRNRSDRPTKPV